MCQTIMFALTIQQTWVVVELCMVVNHIRLQMSGENPSFPQRFTKWARIAVSSTAVTYVIVSLVGIHEHIDGWSIF